MRYKIKIGNDWVVGDPIDGEMCQKEVAKDTWITQRYYSPVTPPIINEFTTANETVKVNGNAVQGFQQVYSGKSGDSITMTFEIVNDIAELQTQLDSASLGYPQILSLPVLKYVNRETITDEIYLETGLVAGVITVTGTFPASGNWKLNTERINAALAEIGANWVINKSDVTFRVSA
jgi:hypothetical protein